MVLDADSLERHRPAVRLALAEIVPVLGHRNARTSSGNCCNEQRAARGVACRRDQHFGIECARAKALLPAELAPVASRAAYCPLIDRVERVAPEPLPARGLLVPRFPLRRGAEQANGSKHQMMKTKHMPQRAVRSPDGAHNV